MGRCSRQDCQLWLGHCNILFRMISILNGLLFRHVFVSIVWSIGAVFLSSQAQAGAPRCDSYFSEQKIVTSLKGQITRVMLKDPSRIKNQCALGTCHLLAWSHKLEQDYFRAQNRAIDLSAHYWTARLWQKRALERIDEILADPANSDGYVGNQILGNVTIDSRAEILEFGIIPETSWIPKSEFDSWDASYGLSLKLQAVADLFLMQAQRLKNPTKIRKAARKAKAQLQQIFEENIGTFPSEFQFNGQNYTPQKFQKTFFPQLDKPLLSLHADRSTDKEINSTFRENHSEKFATLTKFEQTLKKLIDQGLSVLLVYFSDQSLLDKVTGDLKLPENDSAEKVFYDGNHSVVVIGYDVGPNGQILTWHLRNSWGPDALDRGYIHMSAEYFRDNADNIIIPNDELKSPNLKQLKGN